MADIIDAAGMSAGSIYSHFNSKNEIVRSVASEALHGRQEMWSRGDLGEVSASRFFIGLFRESLTRQRAKILLQVWSESALDEDLAVLVREFLASARELLVPALEHSIKTQRGLHGKELESAVGRAFDATLAIGQGCIVRVALDPSVEPHDLLDRFESLLDGAQWA